MHLRDSLNISALVLVPWQHINLDFFLFLLLFFTLTRFEPKKKIDKFIDWLIPTQLLKIWVIWKKSNWFFFVCFVLKRLNQKARANYQPQAKLFFWKRFASQTQHVRTETSRRPWPSTRMPFPLIPPTIFYIRIDPRLSSRWADSNRRYRMQYAPENLIASGQR